MLINDFTAIARTAAVPSKKYGLSICCGGFSKRLNKLIRVYPLMPENEIRQWGKYEIAVEKPSHDSRDESYKLDEEFAPHPVLEESKRKSPKHRYECIGSLIQNHRWGCIQALNASRRSLGIIVPSAITGVEFAEDECEPESYGANATTLRPYIRFVDEGGKHRLQLREIGCYEWLRKRPHDPHGLWKNKRIDDSEYRHVLFVGNFCHQRNVWLIIDLIQVKLGLWEKHGLASILPNSGMEKQTGFGTCKVMQSV